MTDSPSLYSADQKFGGIPPEITASFPGMEVYRRMLAGELPPPPIYGTANIILVSAEEGTTRFEALYRKAFGNPVGTAHGGWIATLLDSALASCVHTRLPAGFGLATVEFKTNIVRPVTASTGKLQIEGEIIHFGKSIATSQARVTTADGKLIAHGVETCSIFKL